MHLQKHTVLKVDLPINHFRPLKAAGIAEK